MSIKRSYSYFKPVLAVVVAGTAIFSGAAMAASVAEVIAAGTARANAGASAQQQVEAVADQTDAIVSDYRTVTKVVDGLLIYNSLLQKQIDNQVAEMGFLSESIRNVALIERQIVPLMTRMIDSLEEFVRLDTPFLIEERANRIERLKGLMETPDVTAAEKFRTVIEAYQIETEYGRTIEAYKGEIMVDGNPQNVDFLRIGRVSLTYQSVGGRYTAAWDNAAKDWVALAPEVYKQQVNRGLRVARKQTAPDMLIVPVAAATEVGR
jgi:hypothetical protein